MKTLSVSAPVIRRFIAEERGATAIEYAMIAGGVAVVIAGVVSALGSSVTAMFESVKSVWPS
jgi:pilus assembly protein Flp/PilA